MKDVLSQSGRVAVVTGGASGIGLASARLLAEHGARVVLCDVNAPLGERAAEALRADGLDARFIACDVTSERAVTELAREVESAYGRCDILFNNAGVIRRAECPDMPERDWDLVVDATIKGAFLMCKHLIPLMKKTGGSIVNTGSGWGLKGGDRAVAYCAAKGGVVNMTRALAIDHGKDNIRVNCVCPGDTDTPLLRDEGRQIGYADEEAFLRESGVGRPLARIGTPRDIAGAVLFFCSELASWITGAALPVDGGGIA